MARVFSFTLISAKYLPDVRNFGTMKVYAEISLRGIAAPKLQTSTDEINGINPKWNACQNYWVSQSSLQEGSGVILDVYLYCQRTLSRDKYVGQVNINLKKLFEGSFRNPTSMTVKVDDSQITEGTIEFSYNFGELETADQVKKDKHSFLKAVIEKAAVAVLAEGVKRVVIGMLRS